MRLGIAHHLGWAVAVTASPDHDVVDRRRIELIEPGLPAAPIHHEGGPHLLHRTGAPLDDDALAALVAEVRASAVRATAAALDEVATALPEPVVSMSVRAWPDEFPDDIAVQRRAPYESRADSVMYCQVLAELAARTRLGRLPLQRPGRRGRGGPHPRCRGARRAARPAGDTWTTVVEGPSHGARGDRRGRLSAAAAAGTARRRALHFTR